MSNLAMIFVKVRLLIGACAIRLRSVNRFTAAFHALLCHPWPCMLLNLRFHADSNPSLSAIFIVTNSLRCAEVHRHFRAACLQLGIRHGFTRPYTPRTNGKAERFIQTALREWAYVRHYLNAEGPILFASSWFLK